MVVQPQKSSKPPQLEELPESARQIPFFDPTKTATHPHGREVTWTLPRSGSHYYNVRDSLPELMQEMFFVSGDVTDAVTGVRVNAFPGEGVRVAQSALINFHVKRPLAINPAAFNSNHPFAVAFREQLAKNPELQKYFVPLEDIQQQKGHGVGLRLLYGETILFADGHYYAGHGAHETRLLLFRRRNKKLTGARRPCSGKGFMDTAASNGYVLLEHTVDNYAQFRLQVPFFQDGALTVQTLIERAIRRTKLITGNLGTSLLNIGLGDVSVSMLDARAEETNRRTPLLTADIPVPIGVIPPAEMGLTESTVHVFVEDHKKPGKYICTEKRSGVIAYESHASLTLGRIGRVELRKVRERILVVHGRRQGFSAMPLRQSEVKDADYDPLTGILVRAAAERWPEYRPSPEQIRLMREFSASAISMDRHYQRKVEGRAAATQHRQRMMKQTWAGERTLKSKDRTIRVMNRNLKIVRKISGLAANLSLEGVELYFADSQKAQGVDRPADSHADNGYHGRPPQHKYFEWLFRMITQPDPEKRHPACRGFSPRQLVFMPLDPKTKTGKTSFVISAPAPSG